MEAAVSDAVIAAVNADADVRAARTVLQKREELFTDAHMQAMRAREEADRLCAIAQKLYDAMMAAKMLYDDAWLSARQLVETANEQALATATTTTTTAVMPDETSAVVNVSEAGGARTTAVAAATTAITTVATATAAAAAATVTTTAAVALVASVSAEVEVFTSAENRDIDSILTACRVGGKVHIGGDGFVDMAQLVNKLGLKTSIARLTHIVAASRKDVLSIKTMTVGDGGPIKYYIRALWGHSRAVGASLDYEKFSTPLTDADLAEMGVHELSYGLIPATLPKEAANNGLKLHSNSVLRPDDVADHRAALLITFSVKRAIAAGATFSIGDDGTIYARGYIPRSCYVKCMQVTDDGWTDVSHDFIEFNTETKEDAGTAGCGGGGGGGNIVGSDGWSFARRGKK